MKKKFKDTKFGGFLTKAGEKGLNVASAIGKAKSGDFIGAFEEARKVFSASDNPESDGLLSEMISQRAELKSDYELFLQDTQDARSNETQRDVSEHSSWLSKNVHELIAIAVIGGWLVTWYFKPQIDYAEITGVVTLILGYLYGRTKPQT